MTLAPYYDDGTITLYCAEAATAADLAPGVAAVVTSPPYNVGLTYDGDPTGDTLAWHDYRHLAVTTADAIAAALIRGGRAWVNTAVSVPEHPRTTTGPKRRVLLGHLWASALDHAGLALVDQVSWQSVRGPGTAWGSWESPTSPNLRGDHELITVACKGGWERRPPAGFEAWRDQFGGWPALCSTVWKVLTVGDDRTARRGPPGPVPASSWPAAASASPPGPARSCSTPSPAPAPPCSPPASSAAEPSASNAPSTTAPSPSTASPKAPSTSEAPPNPRPRLPEPPPVDGGGAPGRRWRPNRPPRCFSQPHKAGDMHQRTTPPPTEPPTPTLTGLLGVRHHPHRPGLHQLRPARRRPPRRLLQLRRPRPPVEGWS